MPRKYSKRLVIDASILRAAGGMNAVDATSRQCRDVLQAIFDICHRAVLTPEIKEEWDRHQSRFALTWRRAMTARKKTLYIDAAPHAALRAQIGRVALNEQRADAMHKDCRLVEAALQADRTVLSRDDTVRALFSTASQSVRELRRIVWVNPDHANERCMEWLAGGAKPEQDRTLGSFVEQ